MSGNPFMPGDATKYLWDARESVARIARFAQGKSFDDYLSDELLRAAIERQFTILGEALGRLRQLDAALGARVSDLPRAVALRNLLVHAYADIDARIVWGVITGQLPRLIAELDAIGVEVFGRCTPRANLQDCRIALG